MFQASAMLFIYVETPLHAGAARGLGAVDLPIQRERATDYPIIQASSLKGRLRAEGGRLPEPEQRAIFGPQAGNASDHAGALSTGDARVLLFPVRSLAGVFAWTTSRDALARFQREAELTGVELGWRVPEEGPTEDEAWVSGGGVMAGERVVLEEFSFRPQRREVVDTIGRWLAAQALPAPQGGGADGYAYWRTALPEKLCLLHEDAFRDFVRYATEVQTHVRLDPETKTVAGGQLWTSESLPADTLLYASLLATPSRAAGVALSAEEVIERVAGLGLARTQLGGDETTGQGIVALRLARGTSGSAGGAA